MPKSFRPITRRVHFPRTRPKQPPTSGTHSALARLQGLLDGWKNIYVAGVAVLGVVAFAILFALGQKPVIVVSKFSLSEDAKKAGYDDLALSRQLAGRIAEVIRTPSSRKDRRAIYSYDSEPTIDFEVDDWSLKALRQLLTQLGTERRYVVTGELVSVGAGKARMTVRVEDSGDFSVQDTLADIDRLMLASAEFIVKSAEPYLYAAYSLAQGRDELALDQIRYCLNHPPTEDDSWAYNLWGVYFLEKLKFAEATDRFRRAIAIDSGLGVAHYNLAQSLEGSGDVPSALASYRRATELWHSAQTLNGYGNLLLKQKNTAEALRIFLIAVQDFPKDVEARVSIALTYLALDRPQDALVHAQQARDFVGFDARVERAFAAVADQLGMKSEALVAYQRLVDNDPSDDFAKFRLSLLRQLSER